jgi:electron transfer flavoprotein alpha/beta subunit
MTIAVILEQVPDVVEELAIAPSGNELDRDTVTYVLNEYDDHALEEALLLAEASGDEVSVSIPLGNSIKSCTRRSPRGPSARSSWSVISKRPG